jgi:two-component system sensor histidine kinase UhpB
VAGRLRVKENLLHLISENASDLIALIDVSGRYLYRSPSRMKLGGDQTSINAVDYVHPEDRSRFREALEKVVDTGINQRVEIRLAISGREVRYLQSELGPVRGPAGTVNAVVVVGRDVTDQRRIQETLHEREESLQALSRRLVELQEFERRQLSRELHDRIGQNLTALNINLNILKTRLSGEGAEELRSRLEDSATLLESTVDAVENVMAELRPPMLDDYGLLPALQWYAKEFSERTGINVLVQGDEPAKRPPPEVEITLFRIAQEALNNVVKHAGATSVEITFRRPNPGCELTVSDDGIGFDASLAAQAKARAGLGMVTMRERAQAVGGQFEVRSAHGRGTRVTVWIPC